VRRRPTLRLWIGFGRLAIFGFALASFVGFDANPAAAQCFFFHAVACPPPTTLFLESLGYFAQNSSQVALTGIQQQIWSEEDRLQSRLKAATPHTAFAEEAPAQDPIIESAFATLAYGNSPHDPQSPIAVKAAQPAAEPSRFSVSAWTQGFVDYENRTGSVEGIDVSRNTMTGGGIGAADLTVQQLTSASDGAVFGLLGGYTTSRIRNADGSIASVRGPSVGAYGAYVNGAFSIDGTVKADYLDIADTATAAPVVVEINRLDLTNYTASGNVNFKQDLGTWWFEPTTGVSYTATAWSSMSKALGMTDGTDTRVQGGARFGSVFDWTGIHFEETLTLLAYDDVTITGGTLTTATGEPMAPTDEGRIFGQAIGRLEAHFTDNWSANVEGEFRGRANVYGVAGRVGATYTFQ
jgi:hypothetical protein